MLIYPESQTLPSHISVLENNPEFVISLGRAASIRSAWEQFETASRQPAFTRLVARHLSISEAELLASRFGLGVTPLKLDLNVLLQDCKKLGQLKLVTRNGAACHEHRGVCRHVITGDNEITLDLGSELYISIKRTSIGAAYAVALTRNSRIRRYIQFFDHQGQSVLEIEILHEEKRSDFDFFQMNHAGQLYSSENTAKTDKLNNPNISYSSSSEQYFPDSWTRQITNESIEPILVGINSAHLPIELSVSNYACSQTHRGYISKVINSRGWLAILDPMFDFNLDISQIASSWIVSSEDDNEHDQRLVCIDYTGAIILQIALANLASQPKARRWCQLIDSLAENCIPVSDPTTDEIDRAYMAMMYEQASHEQMSA